MFAFIGKQRFVCIIYGCVLIWSSAMGTEPPGNVTLESPSTSIQSLSTSETSQSGLDHAITDLPTVASLHSTSTADKSATATNTAATGLLWFRFATTCPSWQTLQRSLTFPVTIIDYFTKENAMHKAVGVVSWADNKKCPRLPSVVLWGFWDELKGEKKKVLASHEGCCGSAELSW